MTVNQEEEITKGSQRIVLVNNLIINRCSVYVGLQSLYYKVVRNLALSSLCRILAHIADLEEKGKTNLYLLKLKKKKKNQPKRQSNISVWFTGIRFSNNYQFNYRY